MSNGIQNMLLLGIAAGLGLLVTNQFIDRKSEDLSQSALKTVDGILGRVDRTLGGEDSGNTGKQGTDKPEGLFERVIDAGFGVTKEAGRVLGDVVQNQVGLTVEQELQLGAEVHAKIAQEQQFLDDPEQQARIERLAGEVLALGSRMRLGGGPPRYKFHIVDSEVVNAFAHVGGYVYVNTGLLALATTDRALQFVLAHEIAHVEQGHCTRELSVALAAGRIGGEMLGNLAAKAHRLVALGYSQDLELEADVVAYRNLRKLGASMDEILAFHRSMLAYEEKQGRAHRNERDGPGGKVVERLDEHFATHPRTQERIDALEALD
jgi:predicted Zn-dependent protease